MHNDHEKREWLREFEDMQELIPLLQRAITEQKLYTKNALYRILSRYINRGKTLIEEKKTKEDLIIEMYEHRVGIKRATAVDELKEDIRNRISYLKNQLPDITEEGNAGKKTEDDKPPDTRGGPPHTPTPPTIGGPKERKGGAALEIPREETEEPRFTVEEAFRESFAQTIEDHAA